jgi:hypothetical protein
MLATGSVPSDFRFELNRLPVLAYTGFAVRTSKLEC